MSGETLLALANEVEAASGPDRRLDYAIMTATVPTGHSYLWDPNDQNHRYTASLDAAMTLVPEGWGWLVSQPNAKALASGLLKVRTPVMGEVQYGCDQRFAVAAATPALALCAAALRARGARHD